MYSASNDRRAFQPSNTLIMWASALPNQLFLQLRTLHSTWWDFVFKRKHNSHNHNTSIALYQRFNEINSIKHIKSLKLNNLTYQRIDIERLISRGRSICTWFIGETLSDLTMIDSYEGIKTDKFKLIEYFEDESLQSDRQLRKEIK